MALKDTFDRVVLVNLRRRSDRLACVRKALAAADWPFRKPERFDAVDGSVSDIPNNWAHGVGAWGCMQSHRQILKRALQDGIGSLLVLEDDACFRLGFAADVARFMAAVPSDWDGLMLGGQHFGGWDVTDEPGVVRCRNCQRTHAYAVRGRLMTALSKEWSNTPSGFLDIVMGSLHADFKVYAPSPFLVGQAGGLSDISEEAWASPMFW